MRTWTVEIAHVVDHILVGPLPYRNPARDRLSKGINIQSNEAPLFCNLIRSGRLPRVAMARRLAIGLYWMWRKGWDYERVKKFGSHAGQLGTGRGVQSNTE